MKELLQEMIFIPIALFVIGNKSNLSKIVYIMI